jgi:hypothetical protein
VHEGIKFVCPKCGCESDSEEEMNLCYLADKGWIDRETGESLLGEASPVASMAKTGWLRALIGR